MTSHPRDMDQRLIDAVARLPHVCEQIHVAIQSGDDQVLAPHAPRYTGESCVELVDRIRRTVPGVGVSTDVIVGFPGETEKQFRRTLDVLRYLPLRHRAHRLLLAAREHCFGYLGR